MFIHLSISNFQNLLNQSQAFIDLFFCNAQWLNNKYHRANIFYHDKCEQAAIHQGFLDISHCCCGVTLANFLPSKPRGPAVSSLVSRTISASSSRNTVHQLDVFLTITRIAAYFFMALTESLNTFSVSSTSASLNE